MTALIHGYYTTTDETTTTDGRKVLVAILTDGSPQYGHDPVTVLTLETFPVGTKHKEIRKWAARMKIEKPWETRQ